MYLDTDTPTHRHTQHAATRMSTANRRTLQTRREDLTSAPVRAQTRTIRISNLHIYIFTFYVLQFTYSLEFANLHDLPSSVFHGPPETVGIQSWHSAILPAPPANSAASAANAGRGEAEPAEQSRPCVRNTRARHSLLPTSRRSASRLVELELVMRRLNQMYAFHMFLVHLQLVRRLFA